MPVRLSIVGQIYADHPLSGSIDGAVKLDINNVHRQYSRYYTKAIEKNSSRGASCRYLKCCVTDYARTIRISVLDARVKPTNRITELEKYISTNRHTKTPQLRTFILIRYRFSKFTAYHKSTK
ncbi:hypothetical protein EVAR_101414_1 [Eumeta japonica]|uniref:Uncharacterized protein n=1 Tax=Eumeta variegata TaxID=151549 RepID=A0A4C1SY89_EUMVA|nr:hypothetical protein EVAR_101414_1 [Eumeta japonica]